MPFSTPRYTTKAVSARNSSINASGGTREVMNEVKKPSVADAEPSDTRYTVKYFVIQPPMTE